MALSSLDNCRCFQKLFERFAQITPPPLRRAEKCDEIKRRQDTKVSHSFRTTFKHAMTL